MNRKLGLVFSAAIVFACSSQAAGDLDDRVKKLEDQVKELKADVNKFKSAAAGRDEQADREVTVSIGDHYQGDKKSPVGIVEFSDFQ